MVDNFTRSPQGNRQGTVLNHRPDESVLYAKRVISMSDLVQPRPATPQAKAPVQATPTPTVPQPVIAPKSAPTPTQPVAQVRPVVDGFVKQPVAPVQVQVPARPVRSFEMVHTETVRTTLTPQGDYRTHEVDEVFVKIAAIESEAPTRPRPVAGALNTAPSRRVAVSAPQKTSAPTAKATVKKFKLKGDLLRYGMAAVAAMFILALTGYVSIDTWVTNSEVKQVVAEKQEASANGGVVLGEGEDETEVTANAVDNYRVASDLPRVLTIDKLDVRARVLPMSVNADGAMQAPINIFDSGWYGASAKPGTPGAAVIDAHASGATREGLFAYLDTLKTGDRLSVERGDGQKFTYEVTHTETVALGDVDMDKLLKPYGGVKEGLNLITCTGTWLPDQKTYDHRVMVYTKRV